jgi:hypothetical protein
MRPRQRLLLCRFLDAGNDEMPLALAAGVQKAPRHEVAGSLAPAVPRALWGFDFRGVGDGGRDAGTRRPAWVCAMEPGSMQWVSQSSRRPYRRAIGPLIGVIGPGEIAASVEPAHRNGKFATLTRELAHDVSILLGVGRHFGSQPRAKTSITIMRAPQCGHGLGSTRGASGVLSGCFCGSAAGGATPRSARAVAMLSARLALARSP